MTYALPYRLDRVGRDERADDHCAYYAGSGDDDSLNQCVQAN